MDRRSQKTTNNTDTRAASACKWPRQPPVQQVSGKDHYYHYFLSLLLLCLLSPFLILLLLLSLLLLLLLFSARVPAAAVDRHRLSIMSTSGKDKGGPSKDGFLNKR